MYEELADYDVQELAEQLVQAFYSGCNEHAKTLLQELAWRIENTGV